MRTVIAIALLSFAVHGQSINETFSSSSLPSGWVPFGGSAAVVNNALRLQSGCIELPGNFSRAGNLVVEFHLTISSANDDTNLWALYDSASCGSGPSNGYAIGWYPAGGDNITDSIGVFVNGQASDVATIAPRIVAGQQTFVKAEWHSDGGIRVYINNVLTLTATNSLRSSGKIAIRSIGTIVVDNVIVTGGGDCSYALSPDSAAFGSQGGPGSFNVLTNSGCAWTVAGNNSFVTVSGSAARSGPGTVSYQVAPNSTNSARNATISAAGQTFSINQAGATCQPTVSPPQPSIPSSAGSSDLILAIGASSCSWSATSNDSWLSISSEPSGNGNGTITYSWTANTSTIPRTGSLTVAGLQVFVVQAGSDCSNPSLSPTAQTFGSAGGIGSVAVGGLAGCPYTAISSGGFFSISSGGVGTIPGRIDYTVQPNSVRTPRSGTITVGGQVAAITQVGSLCQATLAPTRASAPFAAGFSNVMLQMSAADCPWTATSNVPWLGISSAASGTGSATITYNWTANTSPVGRTGILTIAGLPFALTQSGTDCTGLTLSDTDATIAAAGGSGNVTVSTPAGCPYTATPSGGFFAITSGAAGNGFGRIEFTVQPNNSPAARTGTITVGNQVLAIRQSGGSTPTVSCDVAEVASPATLLSTGRTEVVSPLAVQCAGRSGGNPYAADIIVSLNTNVTNRITILSTETTDAVLQLSSGATIAGRVEGPNSLRFPNVPLSAGEAAIDTRLVITNVRSDAALLGTGTTAQLVFATVDVQSPIPTPVANATRLVGQSIGAALVSFLGASRAGPSAGQTIVPLTVQEGSATVFKTREGEAGDTATRVRVRITNIPAGVGVFAPVQSDNGRARLMSADENGAGGSAVNGAPRAGGSYAAVPVNGGIGIATWEVTAADAATVEALTLSILVENAAQTQLTAMRFEAALGPVTTVGIASSTAPVPRFTDPSQTLAVVNLRMQSRVQGTGTRPVAMRIPVAAGSTATFLYSVTNDSDVTARNVVIRNTLPQGLTGPNCLVNGGACQQTTGGVRITIDSLAPGQQITASMTAMVGGVGNCPNCISNGTVLQNVATAGADQLDPDLSNNTSETAIEVVSPCSFGLSRNLVTATPAGGTLQVDVSTGPACEFTSQNAVAGVTLSPAGPYRGSTTLTLQIAANTTASSRTGTITVAGLPLRVTQAAANCGVTLATPNSTFPSQAGASTAQVTANPGCGWEVQAFPDWIRLTTASGQGSGSVSFAVTENQSAGARTGTIEVAGEQLRIVQSPSLPVAGTCNFAVTPAALSIGGLGAGSTINVATTDGCPWTASSNVSWIAVTSAVATSGSGVVWLVASANSGSTPRSGLVRIAGRDVSVTQPVASPSPGLRFVPLLPCRLMETRQEYNFEGRTGAFGPPSLNAGETRTLTVANSNVCPVPASARGYILNVTVVPKAGGVDFVTLFPGGQSRPKVWSIRSPDGQVVANSAIVESGSGAIQVHSASATDLIIDISGYLTDNPQTSNLVYYPLTPCRVVETRAEYRSPPGPFGPPSLVAGQTRRFRLPASPYCQVPVASAYSVTMTAIPPGPLQYLTAWPAGLPRPNVSNMNSFAGRVLANTVIVPASSDGSIDVFTPDRADFLVDINGYFAPDDGVNGLYYYPVPQCRAADSQSPPGPFGGPIFGDESARTIAVAASGCGGIPATARGYAISVTALPGGNPMPFLTAHPAGQPRPNASILNAFQGQIVTNTAIIPAGANGVIEVFAFRRTHVVVDVSGYFGR